MTIDNYTLQKRLEGIHDVLWYIFLATAVGVVTFIAVLILLVMP